MISVNLLKTSHGMRARFEEELRQKSQNRFSLSHVIAFLIFFLLLAVGVYLGKQLLLDYFDKLDNKETFSNIRKSRPVRKLQKKKIDTSVKTVQSISTPKITEKVKNVDTNIVNSKSDSESQKNVIEKFESKREVSSNKEKRVTKTQSPDKFREFPYVLQVATFINETNAVLMDKNLRSMGYSSIVKKRNVMMPTYRVSYNVKNREDADKIKNILTANNIVHGLKSGKKTDIISKETFFKDETVSILTILKKNNIMGKIVEGRKKSKVNVVYVVGFETREEAMVGSKELKKKGFAPVIIHN